jgi:hypothetical protein
MVEGVQHDPWFWISIVSISGWIYFLYRDLPRNYYRVPADLRRRISKVLGRPILLEAERGVILVDQNRFFKTAAEVLLHSLAEREAESRGVPPEVFQARRGARLDS